MHVERMGSTPLKGGRQVEHPVSGSRDVPVLQTLAGYRRSDGEICFGVDAEVAVPGRASLGDPVVLGRD